MRTSGNAFALAHKNFIPLKGAIAPERQDAIYVDISFSPAVRDALGVRVPLHGRMVVGGHV